MISTPRTITHRRDDDYDDDDDDNLSTLETPRMKHQFLEYISQGDNKENTVRTRPIEPKQQRPVVVVAPTKSFKEYLLEETEMILYTPTKGLFWSVVEQGLEGFFLNMCSSGVHTSSSSTQLSSLPFKEPETRARTVVAAATPDAIIPSMVQVQYQGPEEEDLVQYWRRHLSFDVQEKEEEDDSLRLFVPTVTAVPKKVLVPADPSQETLVVVSSFPMVVGGGGEKAVVEPNLEDEWSDEDRYDHPFHYNPPRKTSSSSSCFNVGLNLDDTLGLMDTSSPSSLKQGAHMKHLHLPPSVYVLAAAYDAKVASQQCLKQAYQGISSPTSIVF